MQIQTMPRTTRTGGIANQSFMFTRSRPTVGRSAASRASEASGPSECEGGESAATPCSADRRFPATDATGTQRELEAATLSYRQTMSWSIFRPTAIGPPGRRTATSRRPRTVADQNSGRLTHRSAARLHRLRRPRPLHLLVRRRRLPWWHLEPPLKHPGLGPELREVVQGLPKAPEAAPWTAEPFPPVAMPAQCPGKSIASALVERPELACRRLTRSFPQRMPGPKRDARFEVKAGFAIPDSVHLVDGRYPSLTSRPAAGALGRTRNCRRSVLLGTVGWTI